MSISVALLPNYMQIIQNWLEKGVVWARDSLLPGQVRSTQVGQEQFQLFRSGQTKAVLVHARSGQRRLQVSGSAQVTSEADLRRGLGASTGRLEVR